MSDSAIIDHLMEENRKWAATIPHDIFAANAKGQSPKTFFFGCSDSRLCPSTMFNVQPGEMFVHRNPANIATNTDVFLHTSLHYTVAVLKVECIIVCGHLGCGGMKTGLSDKDFGPLNTWVRCVKDVYQHHRHELEGIKDAEKKEARLCELNVENSMRVFARAECVQQAWREGRKLVIYGLVYDVATGLVRRIKDMHSVKDVAVIYQLNEKA